MHTAPPQTDPPGAPEGASSGSAPLRWGGSSTPPRHHRVKNAMGVSPSARGDVDPPPGAGRSLGLVLSPGPPVVTDSGPCWRFFCLSPICVVRDELHVTGGGADITWVVPWQFKAKVLSLIQSLVSCWWIREICVPWRTPQNSSMRQILRTLCP